MIGLVDTPISLGESRSNLMASSILYSVCAIIAIVSTVSGQEGGTCQACNCQLNNVEVLNRLIESHMRSGKLHVAIIKQNCTMKYILLGLLLVYGEISNPNKVYTLI